MDKLLSAQDVAAIMGVSYRTALVFIHKNKLVVRIGRQYRVPESALTRHIQKEVN